jgi:hypothetical protein
MPLITLEGPRNNQYYRVNYDHITSMESVKYHPYRGVPMDKKLNLLTEIELINGKVMYVLDTPESIAAMAEDRDESRAREESEPDSESESSLNPNLKPCPFCGVTPEIGISDNEGNLKDWDSEYENDPWSGLTFYIRHDHRDDENCPIASHMDEIVGTKLYDSREELAARWNNRK